MYNLGELYQRQYIESRPNASWETINVVCDQILYDIHNYQIRQYYDIYYDSHDPNCDKYVKTIRECLKRRKICGIRLECVGISKETGVAAIRINPNIISSKTSMFRPESSQELTDLLIRTSSSSLPSIDDLEKQILDTQKTLDKLTKDLKSIKKKMKPAPTVYRLIVCKRDNVFDLIYGPDSEATSEKELKHPNTPVFFESTCFSFKKYLLDMGSVGETLDYRGLTYEYKLKDHCTDKMFLDLLERCVQG